MSASKWPVLLVVSAVGFLLDKKHLPVDQFRNAAIEVITELFQIGGVRFTLNSSLTRPFYGKPETWTCLAISEK